MTYDTYGHWLEKADEHDKLSEAELAIVGSAT